MTRPGRASSALSPVALAVGALLVAGPLAASAQASPSPAAVSQAVVTWSGTPVPVAGVDVVRSLPALHAAVVRGSAASLARLARTRGVRGLAPDDAVVLTGGAGSGPGVRAAEGLSGPAGTPQAGRGVRVALVDTGVTDTAALSRAGGRLVDAVDTSHGDPVTSGVFDDGYGHGTFLASVLAGGTTSTVKHPVGVAPGATVLVVRVADRAGETSLSRVLGGLDWVAAHASSVDVANLSFSHQRPAEAYGADPLTDAVERVRSAGVTVVVSAGNTAGQVGDPGFDPRIVSVGAADLPAEQVAAFSGSAVVAGVRRPDVVASGVGVLGLLPPDSVIGRSVTPRADGLSRGTGSSQATAVVSGAVALLLAQHPDATPAQVKASLRSAAVDLPGERDGAGLLRTPKQLVGGPDGTGPAGSGDLSGEGGFDASSWSASSWSASSWSASSWSASSWSASSWSASSWS
ncbi:MAG: peptidase and in, kexin, sedolisin [Frankiales bacterium]|nr:peptidase and in, kexin, sedolisin [Frankiales bacterium]